MKIREKIRFQFEFIWANAHLSGKNPNALDSTPDEFIDKATDKILAILPTQQGMTEKELGELNKIIDEVLIQYNCLNAMRTGSLTTLQGALSEALSGKLPRQDVNREKNIFNLDIKTMELIDWLKQHCNHKLFINEYSITCDKDKETFIYKIPEESSHAQIPEKEWCGCKEPRVKPHSIKPLGEQTQFWCKGYDPLWKTIFKLWDKVEELITKLNEIIDKLNGGER
jgi:hypothetical protein